MKEVIVNKICQFVAEYQSELNKSYWDVPLVGFASAGDELFLKLKKVVSETHFLPADLLSGAQTVLAFFIPFEKWIIDSNVEGEGASAEWSDAYVITNKMIGMLSGHLKNYIEHQGYEVATVPPTHSFHPDRLISDWSHRHVAYIAGLGSFGINNMLITAKGCCGRFGSIVTSVIAAPDVRNEVENCLDKSGYICGKCVRRCVSGALSGGGFDRFACYRMCRKNEKLHQYPADVCGKCLVGLPCSIKNPTADLLKR